MLNCQKLIKIMFITCFTLGIGGICNMGNAVPTLNNVLRSVPAPSTVKLNHDLTNWDRSGAIVMADNIEKPKHIVRVTSMYDKTSLYLAFEFKDPTPMINHVDPKTSVGMSWCGDTVQLRFNTSPDMADRPQNAINLVHIDGYWYTEGKQAVSYVVYADMTPGGKSVKSIEQAVGKGIEMSFKPDADGKGYLQIMKIDRKILRPEGEAYRRYEEMRLGIETMWGMSQYGQQAADRVVDLLNPKRPEREMFWANSPAYGKLKLMDEGNLEPCETALMWPSLVEKYEELQKDIKTPATPPAEIKPAEKAPNRPCLEEKDETQELLNKWFADGTAAGNAGDFYDNRDRDHAAIQMSLYPQLQRVAYTAKQKAKNEDYALFLGVLPHVAFGNSSTASQPERGGCNPRHAMVKKGSMAKLYKQYRGNNLYVYPAHHDYLPGHNGQGFYGDLLPINSLYTLLSKGSSGSDIPFLNAFIHTTAAFQPETKKILLKKGLLIPTLQSILRTSNTQVIKPEDYFTGKANPAVFRGDQINELKMVTAAHAMTPKDIVPLPMIKVIKEDRIRPGINAPENTPSEKLCDTPCVIGRVFRRWDRTMRMTVSASGSYDWMHRPLIYRWTLLQGDPKLVTIEPSKDGSTAKLAINWHDRFPVEDGSTIETNRVDIGVFASTGEGWSAPAMISVYCPDNELRTYDQQNRLVDIHYAAGDTKIGYDTQALLPAEGIPPYQIQDWTACINSEDIGLANELVRGRFNYKDLSEDIGLANELVRGRFNYKDLKIITTVCHKTYETFNRLKAAREANPPGSLNMRWITERNDAITSSQPLLKPLEIINISVKEVIEEFLNEWINDPEFYIANHEKIDAEAAKLGTVAVDELSKARQRLINLGIYQNTTDKGWKIHSVCAGDKPITERLTKYERLELQRFHLIILNKVMLPGILVREYKTNYVDFRIAKSTAQWMIFEYDKNSAVPVKIRVIKTDEDKAPLPLEDP
jgi:hypothetical protein